MIGWLLVSIVLFSIIVANPEVVPSLVDAFMLQKLENLELLDMIVIGLILLLIFLFSVWVFRVSGNYLVSSDMKKAGLTNKQNSLLDGLPESYIKQVTRPVTTNLNLSKRPNAISSSSVGVGTPKLINSMKIDHFKDSPVTYSPQTVKQRQRYLTPQPKLHVKLRDREFGLDDDFNSPFAETDDSLHKLLSTPGRSASKLSANKENHLALDNIFMPSADNQQKFFMTAEKQQPQAQIAYGVPISSAPKSRLSQLKPAYEAANDEAAYKILSTLKYNNVEVSSAIDGWTDNLKKVLAHYVKTSIIKPFDSNVDKFLSAKDNKNNFLFPKSLLLYEDIELDQDSGNDYSQQNNNMCVNCLSSLNINQSQQLSQSSFQQSLIYAINYCNQLPDVYQRQNAVNTLKLLTAERNRLESYLKVRRYLNTNPFSKGYVYSRLKELSNNNLNKFKWDSGSNYQGIVWDCSILPTDAELVMHVACQWLDSIFTVDTNQPSFLQLHVKDSKTSKLSSLMQSNFWGIYNASEYDSSASNGFRPHYKVFVQGEVWDVRHGRLNVFQTVALFLFSIKQANLSIGQEAINQVIHGTNIKK